MAVNVEKIAELEYSELLTLRLIEKDQDLNDVFREDNKLPFSLLYTMSKDGRMTKELSELVKDLFNQVVLTTKNYVSQYKRLQREESETDLNYSITDVSTPKVEEASEGVNEGVNEISEGVNEGVIEEAVEVKPKAIKKGKDLPKRYGKRAIEMDIQNQGGKATSPQLTGLALNGLKNDFLIIESRTINDMLTDSPILSDEQHREVRAAIKMFDKKLKSILNQK